MRYIITLALTLLANSALSNSVTFLGTNASGNAVFNIVNSSPGPQRYDLTINGVTTYFDGMEIGSNIVEYPGSVADGTTVVLMEDATFLLDTITISNASSNFVLHTESNRDAVTVSTPLLLDAIKENNESSSSINTSIASNTQKISKNSVGIAEAMALGVMQMDLNYEGLQTSLGFANFNGSEGFAFMAGKTINSNTFISFSSTSTGNVAGGVTIKW